MFVFLFKQKTAYEMRISDWSSDVCSSDLADQDLRRVLVLDPAEPYVRGRLPHGEGGGRLAFHHPLRHRRLLQQAVQRNHVAAIAGVRMMNRAGDEIGRASCRARVGQYV